MVTLFQRVFDSRAMCSTCNTHTHSHRYGVYVCATNPIYLSVKIGFRPFWNSKLLMASFNHTDTDTHVCTHTHIHPVYKRTVCVAILLEKPESGRIHRYVLTHTDIEWIAEVETWAGKMCKTHGLDEKSNRKERGWTKKKLVACKWIPFGLAAYGNY